MVLLAVVFTTSVALRSAVWPIGLGLVWAVGRRSALVAIVVVVLSVTGVVRSGHAWSEVTPDRLDAFVGWALVADDPQPFATSTRVIFEIEGERFEHWSRGRARQLRVREWRAGEWVRVSGRRVALDRQRAERVAWQHVVGAFELDWASDVAEGGPLARASNRVRAAIERSASHLPDPDAALFRGLVIGDDRDQSRAMIERFRVSGLAHLTAVSGQNVAFVLAAAGPLLRRCRPWIRFGVSAGLIGWFVVMTRFEPSILRAGLMAVLSAWAFVTGRERSPIRMLAIAVLVLGALDPLLVWSIGFWLSVGATAGVVVVGPWLAGRLGRIGMLAAPVGITLGAQVGVAVPSVLVFGRLPLVSLPANLLAVPVAGLVMLYGLPAALIGGTIEPLAGPLLAPAHLGTRWVDTVSILAARVEPPTPWSWYGWIVVLAALASVAAFGTQARGGKNRGRDDDPPPQR